MAEASSILTSTIIGMIGVVIGAIISNYFNQKIARESARKDMIFRKKMDYFEGITECIGSNIKLYQNTIKEAERNNNIRKIISSMKKNRKKFRIMSSPLYINTKIISHLVREFVSIEKRIFFCFEEMKKKRNMLEELKITLHELKAKGNIIASYLKEKLNE